MNNRRRFLFGAAALLAAPAIARASSLMPVSVLNPVLWGDGFHDDTTAIQRLIDKEMRTGLIRMPEGRYLFSDILKFRQPGSEVLFDARAAYFVATKDVPVLFSLEQCRVSVEGGCFDLSACSPPATVVAPILFTIAPPLS